MVIFMYMLALLLLLNVISCLLVGLDKRRSIHQTERVPEVWFFFLASCFASLGVLLGMIIFHHKTRKVYFPLGIGLLVIEQSVLIACIYRLLN